MRSERITAPRISKPLLNCFLVYIAWFLGRNFHAVRVSRTGAAPSLQSLPAVICMNHPGWWDPLIALTMAYTNYPERLHFGPIEASSLTTYGFFEKLGFFGIDTKSAAGAARFLRVSEAILDGAGSALWVTAQGTFVDPRVRPTTIRGGIGHLVRRLPAVAVVPLAMEFPFWEQRYPEALVRFGEPLVIRDGSSFSASHWTTAIAARLEETQDALQAEALLRNPDCFETVLGGRAGVGGIYDLWRALKARL